MTSYQSISISRAANSISSGAADWVRLEQIVPAKTGKYASLTDVYRAWNLAASGISPRVDRANGCPVEFDGDIIRVFLGFYAWPSRPDLEYQLSTTIGTIGQAQIIRLPREFSAFANNTTAIDLHCYMEDVVVAWESPVFNRYGEEIPPPAIINHNTWLELSAEAFGAMRIKGNAVGGYYILTIDINKKQWDDPEIPPPSQVNGDITYVNPLPYNRTNADKITGLSATITATWIASDNTAATDQLPLEIPQCVLDVLAFCPGNPGYNLDWCEDVSTTIVYFSACTGEILKICEGLDPHSYCTRISTNTDPGPWLRRGIN